MTKLWLKIMATSVLLAMSEHSMANSEDAYEYSNAAPSAAETNLCDTSSNTYLLTAYPNDTASLLLANLCAATDAMTAAIEASAAAAANSAGTAKTNVQTALGTISYS